MALAYGAGNGALRDPDLGLAPEPGIFDRRLAPLAQSAERFHGKEKVYGSIP